MAQNSISYEGRIVVKRDSEIKFTRSRSGMHILELVLAEQHSMKKGRARKDPNLQKYVDDDRNIGKSDDDYINTTVSWHKLTVFGEKAEAYAQNEDFNHGALIEVHEASYVEESPWETKDGVSRAGRPETIGDNKGSLVVKFGPRVKDGEEPLPAIWDGISDVPEPKGSGGPREVVEYGDDEGF